MIKQLLVSSCVLFSATFVVQAQNPKLGVSHIEKADKEELFALAGKKGMELDIPEIPELMIDNTDRNRTSPFAFTGNRFEFRAVGSEANCASSLIVLNAAVAEALENFKARVDALIAKGEDQTSAIIDIVREDIKTCKPIRFDGNGYSDEWKEEAQKRGLDCEASCPVVFDRYLDKESIEMFAKTNVMSESELKADREEIEDVLAEGMELKLLRAPAEITGRDGEVAATRVARSRKSSSKRRRPAALAVA